MSKKGLIEPKRLKGFRDYPPTLMSERWRSMEIIRRQGALAGFQLIGTPALEYATTLLGQGGEETDKQVYRFKDHGDRDVALRFDLTVPFARFVAENQGTLTFPFKKLQMGDVWRGENTQKGRYREFCQCDFDVVGVDSAAADIEVLAVLARTLVALEVGPFTQAVGHRLILTALIRRFLGDLDPAKETQALIAIDKLAKIGVDKVVQLLKDVVGAERADGEGAARELLAVISAKDSTGQSDLKRVEAALADDAAAMMELKRLKDVLQGAQALVRAPAKIVADMTIARGLGYYTGVVFETTLDELPGFGSISSGGRYNGLVSRFVDRELPGVGGSIGLDRLLAGVEELGRLKAAPSVSAFIAIATPDALGYGAKIAGILRDAGMATDLGLVPKLANQFKHADRLGAKIVLTVGTSERDASTFALKNMGAGTETRDLPLSTLLDAVRSALAT